MGKKKHHEKKERHEEDPDYESTPQEKVETTEL